ncbi:SAM-dependent methyltransferase [Rugosimonospora africana]|uniref:S-adenosyl methyltransferase n=1 Tax=Rugosimonospora africana TaxID=556532 RepID=A0A8J3R0S5_9ACTN|nr:SAM-dependent methyltransferase [Rugosimonospora africana]GIH20914.1 hypothetical protein Raf01_90860 [Rugosimonospora africana]
MRWSASTGAPSEGLRSARSGIDTSVAHPARRYGYWLGGKDHFTADRASGDAIAAAFPDIRTAAAENRRLHRRVVTFLAGQAGVRQFLDIGAGIPGPDNTHEVAQRIDPACRVVYVDNDPIVINHSRALLSSSPQGATAVLDADVRTPQDIRHHSDVTGTLDLTRPVALLLFAVLHFLPDEDKPHEVVAELVDALPAGSYLAVSHATYDFMPPHTITALEAATAVHDRFQPRTLDEVDRFFYGLEVVAPGVVPTPHWRPDDQAASQPTPAEAAAYTAVARIPPRR